MTDTIPGTKNFTWREALFLPRWNRFAHDGEGLSDEVLDNLERVFKALQLLRDRLQSRCWVHVAFRPKDYNTLVGGAPASSHLLGMAVDFHFDGHSCDEVRKILVDENLLERWGIRCEDKPGTNWVHIDVKDPGKGKRFFKP